MPGSQRCFATALFALCWSTASPAQPTTLDRAIIAYRLPDQIPWADNPRGGNRSASLQGDPSKPGPYARLLQWLPGHMSGPHFSSQ
jgi:hypothetical protein